MDLSPNEIAEIKQAVETTVRALHAAHLTRGDGSLERFMSFFDEDVFAIGTGQEEIMKRKSGLRTFIEREWQEISHDVHHVIHSVHVQVLSRESAYAHTFMALTMSETGEGEYVEARLSSMLRKQEEDWRVIGWHASTPWDIQPEGVSWPTDELQARAEKLEKEVAARTEELSRANRELEIDAALERIRRVTGEMQDPSDLVEVVKQIRVEVGALYGGAAVEVGLMQEANEETFKFWSIFDVEDVPEDLALFGLLYPKKPDPPHPMLDRVWGAEGAFSLLFFDLEDLWRIHASLERYSPEEARHLKVLLESGDIEGGWQTVSSIHVGRVYFGWVAEPPEELASVQPRIAALLTEAQLRVEELQTAQHMAREAEINLAVEKVRARATAMHRSEELAEVALTLRDELQNLGISGVSSSTVYTSQGDGAYRIWDMAEIQGVDDSQVHLDFVFRPDDAKGELYFNDILAADGYSSFLYEGERLRSIASWLQDYDPASAETMFRLVNDGDLPSLWISSHPVERGFLSVDTVEPPSDELGLILPRMAAAFDLAYRRFEDLKKAEAQARQAEINLAVEKVRTRASGMQTSGEIVDVADVLREQMVGLGLSDVLAATVYTRTADGKHRVSEMARLEEGSSEFSFDWIFDPADLNPQVMVHDFLAAETTTVFHEDAEAMALLLKEALKYDPDYTEDYQRAMDEGGISEMWVAVCPAESIRLCIDFMSEPPEEVLTILPRMARAFDHAYKRHQDLERAEAQAREAQIEAALERIRGRAMAMRSTDELSEVSLLLDKEIRALGPKTWGCAFNIYGEEDSTEWFGGEMGVRNPYKVPREKYFREFYERGQAGESLFIREFPEGECAAHYDYMKTLPGLGELLVDTEAAGIELPASQIDHVAYFKYGYLLFITLDPAPEMHDVFQRFAKVFEQSYTRFLDLERAEGQAREAQIEAALERIRGRALAMRSSKEMIQVADELRRQMHIIGQDDLEACAIHVYDTEGDDFESWGAIRDPEGKHAISNVIRLFPRKGVGPLEEMIRRYESDESDYVIVNEGEWAKEFFDMLKERAPEPHAALMAQMPPGMKPWDMKAYWSVADFDGGSIVIVTYQPADEESRDLLRRAAKVFNLAYRRFKDLQEAEAAAREARIENALEKIRSRTMGMQTGEELKDVVVLLYKELIDLGVTDFVTCGYVEINEDEQIQDTWVTSPGGDTLGLFYLPLQGDATFDARYAAWKKQEPIFHQTVAGQERSDHLEYAITKFNSKEAEEMVRGQFPDPTVFYCFNFSHGYLHIVGGSLLEKEEELLVARFTKVFEQTYTRFLDLQKAEAAARESQIEAALERVRAVATAMRSSDELLKVMQHIHKEFSGLGFPCGAFWNSRYLETHYEKAVTDMDGSQVTAIMELPRDFSMIPELAAWERSTEKLGVFKFGTEASIEYLNHMIAKGKFLEIVPGVLTEELLREKGGWTFIQARTTHGELGYNLWGETDPSQEATDTLLRFAAVFDLAFRRFVDLEEAEAQARESKIEAALERVRGQAMAMQKPEDISDVSVRMFDELEALGVETLRSGISIAGDAERYQFHAATKDEAGQTTLVLGDESVNVHPIIRRAYDGWKDHEAHQVTMLEGDDLVAYYHAVFDTMPLPDWKERMQTGNEAQECFATFPFQDGWLYTFTRERISDEDLSLHERFARVFGLAYQRYHDLTKAEEDYRALLAEKARTEKALADLQATQKQLVEQEKLASLGSLTAGIAHEIKNPLNFVNNFAEVSTELMEELAEAVAKGDAEEAAMILDDLRDNATQIAKHGKRADSIVRSMMQHARGGASEQETIVVNDFLEEYANLAWHGMRARDHGFQAEVKRDFDPSAGSLDVMPQELGRVVLNLLNNAFDAVKTRDDGYVTVTSRRSEDRLTITVSDNGPGIPEDIRQKIFEPFFTTKATGEGTGLGLSLSYDIVTKGHGGSMTVGESPDGGALFTITIPVDRS